MKQIILYGVPGTGKSTTGELLAASMRVPFYELDLLRRELPHEATDPYLRAPSTLAWQLLGSLNSKNAVDGFMRVRQSLRPYVTQKLKSLDSSFVAESAFIDPHTRPANLALVITKSVSRHYSRFFVHRQPSTETDLQFRAARFIQDELVKEARGLGIPVIDNDSAPKKTLEVLVENLE